MTRSTWLKSSAIAVKIEDKTFSSWAFHDAFQARSTLTDSQTDQLNAVKWVKKYREIAEDNYRGTEHDNGRSHKEVSSNAFSCKKYYTEIFGKRTIPVW